MWEGRKRGFINKKGKLVINANYDEVTGFIGDLARVSKSIPSSKKSVAYIQKSKSGLINKKGKMILPLRYDEIMLGYVNNGEFTMIEKDGKYGFVDDKGKIVIPVKYGYRI